MEMLKPGHEAKNLLLIQTLSLYVSLSVWSEQPGIWEAYIHIANLEHIFKMQ